jgi:hypothetical protein
MDERKAQLIEIVGSGRVFNDPEMGGSFSLAHSLIPPIRPRYMVKPRDVGDVQKIVLWENQTLTPLVPMSSAGRISGVVQRPPPPSPSSLT